jgi:ABC-type sulfate/molybdate transport systems ATPase subunit
LSGGERQRVALARALSFYPDVLCLDEPLSALDEDTVQEMYELLTELKENNKITVLHISHSKTDAIKLADKVLLFENGALKELDPHKL